MKNLTPFLFFPIILLVITLFSFRQIISNQKIENNHRTAIDTTRTTKGPSHIPTPFQETTDINLILMEPDSGAVTDASSIVVRGSTEPKVAVVVNDQEVTADENGEFQASVLLDEGENYISIVAYNEAGSVSEREIIVIRTISGI